MSSPPRPEDVLDSGYIQPGTSIGFYVVETRIGAGGFGAVYRVRRLDRIYALKLSQARLSDVSPEDRQHMEDRLAREVSALNSLRHPNIVRVHGFERWPDMDGFQYIVMDYVEGRPLLEWVRQARPTPKVLLAVFGRLARALQEMHRLEVFHRDLKSANVLVRAHSELGPEPVIVDFGLARPRSAYTVTRADWLLGTLSHFAPEYVDYLSSEAYRSGAGRFVWRPTTDLYALGVVLYEALTGREPHRGDDEGALLDHIQRVTPASPSSLNRALPGAVDALAMKLLAKNPAERHQSGEELAREIDELLERAESRDAAWAKPLGDVDGAVAQGGTVGARGVAAASPEPPPPPQGMAKPEQDPAGPAAVEALAKSVEVALESLAAPERVARAEGNVFSIDGRGHPSASKRSKRSERSPGARTEAVLPSAEVKAFVAPDLSPEAPARHAQLAPDGDAQLRGVAEKLRAVRTAPSPAKWLLPAILAAFVLLGASLALGTRVVQARSPKPVDLLARVEKADQTAVLTRDVAPPTKPDTSGEASRVPPLPPAAAAQSEHEEASLVPRLGPRLGPSLGVGEVGDSGARGHRDDAEQKAIRALAQDAYGRPRIPGPGETSDAGEASGPGSSASPFAQVQRIDRRVDRRVDGKPSESGRRKFGIPLGAHIRVRLMSNLDSSTNAEAPAEARLLRSFYVKGDSKLPAGTMFYGDWRAAQGRFSIRFDKLVLPDQTELAIAAVAMDGEDRKPGLKAGRTIASEQPQGDGTAMKVGKATASVLLATLPGDTSGQVAQRAGQTVLDDSGATGGQGQAVGLLDSGVDFDLFVKEAF